MLCRLCINESDDFLNIFDKNEEQLDIAHILGRHFWFKPQPDDLPSKVICSNCWLKVIDFHKFYVTIEETQCKYMETLDVKQESQTPPFGNVFVDLNVNIKEEKSLETAAGGENVALNPFCELDCDDSNNKEDSYSYEVSEQSNEEDPMKIEEKSSSISPVRKKRKCVAAKRVPVTKKNRVIRKDNGMDKEKTEKSKLSYKSKGKNNVKTKQEDDEMVKKYIQMNCEMCSHVSDDYPALRKHFRTQHPKEKAFIHCCNRKLFHRLEIIHHAYKHENPDFFKCKVCQKNFSEQSTLSRHMIAMHAPEEDLNFPCDQCPKKFARQKQLEFHRNSHVPMDQRTFICDQCPNSRFASNDLLKIHICMRHRRAANVCYVCAKEIRDKASFERHVSAHFEEMGPKVKCPYDDCDHWLKDERNLHRHIRRLHTTEQKRVTCDECGRECKDKSALSKHKNRVHSNIVFTCEQCNKTFKRAIYLREHMAQHTGEILYKCPFCTRTFNSNANMHAHKKKMHPAEWDNWRKTNNGSLLQFSRQFENNYTK